MGTKVHFINNLPAFYSMRDLNEDSDDFLCQYYENKPAGRSLYNGYQLEPSSGYSEYDNEMIKRTMLEHEAIFRKQVYELHRLYRTQKEIMDELMKAPCNLLQGDTSQSNSFSSQIPSKGTSKMFQLAHLPDATTSNKRAPLTITDDMKPTLNFLNDSSVQSGTVLSRKEIALKDGDIRDSNHKELPRRMFDLELPADVYVDCEDGERSGKEIVAESSSVTTVPLDRTKGADPGKHMKLTLCMNEDPNCKKKISKSDIHMLNGPFTRNLSDLNEPAREIYFGKAAGSVSAKCLGTNNPLAEYQSLQLPMRSSTSLSGLPTAFLKGRHSEGGANSNHFHRDDDETIREWPFFNNEAGRSVSSMKLFSPDSSKEKFSMPSERIQLNQKPHEILSIDQNKTLAWFKPRLDVRRGPLYGHSSAASPNSFSDPYLNYANSSSPLLSSWTKPVNGCSHVPLAAPSHQRFPGSATQSHGNPFDKWQYSGDLRSDYRVCMDSTSYPNSFNRGIRLDYNSASQLHAPPLSFGKPNLSGRNDHNPEGCGPQKSHKDVHSNQTLLNGFRDGFTTEKVSESPQNFVDASPSWLKKTPTCNASSLMGLDLSQGYPQLKASCGTMSAVCEKRQETEKSINFFNVQSIPSSSQAKEITTEGNVASEGQSSKRLFGFGIPARNQQSTSIAPHQEKSQTVATEYDNKDELKHSTVGTHIDPGDQVTRSSSLRSHIDLNFDLNLSDVSGEGEMLNAPLQASALTLASMIDLEAPIVLEEGQQEDVLVTEAAENILWIALDKCSHLDKMNPLFLASFNILHWFAEVASSNAETVKETSDYGSDTFEQLTLELEETKPEEYSCWSREGLDQKEEDDDDNDRKSNIASLLLTKPRRGHQRKRRQKRDFQRDILPGLVSLARQEITEDFQIIGALMKASGLSWKAGGTTRRNGSRSRTNARGRVGRNPRNLVATVEETQVSPPPPQIAVVQPANNSEVEVEVGGKNMIGWGRTTRRCRRQRLPPATNVAPPLT